MVKVGTEDLEEILFKDAENSCSISKAASGIVMELACLSGGQPRPDVGLQPACQSGASPDGMSSRFLVYNGVGVIKSHNRDHDNSLDVEFHDIAVHHRLHLSNSEGATLAALSKEVLATATVGDDVVGGKLMVNHFSSGDINKEWSILFEGEKIRGVAAGDTWVAVVTNKNHLRMFTAAGLKREVVMVIGPLVTMVGKQDRLMVLTHGGHPVPGQQPLSYTLYSVNTSIKLLNTSPLPIPLAPGSELNWAGFSDTLTPYTADTAGWVRALDQNTGLWHPIINTRDHISGQSDCLHIVSVSHTEAVLRGVLCKPPIKPYFQATAFPVESLHTTTSIEQEDFKRICLSKFIHVISSDKSQEDTVEHSEVECVMKLFAFACKSDHDNRAMDVATLLPNINSMRLAIKYASDLRRVGLVERLEKHARELQEQHDKEEDERKVREQAGVDERREMIAPVQVSPLPATIEAMTSHGELDDVKKIKQAQVKSVDLKNYSGFFADVNVDWLNNCSIIVHGGVRVRANLSILSCGWPGLLPLVDSSLCQDDEIVLIMPWAERSTVQSVINLLYRGTSGLVSEDQAFLINEFVKVVNFQINLTKVVEEVASDNLSTAGKETFIVPCYDEDSDEEDSDNSTTVFMKEAKENVQKRDKVSFVAQKQSVKFQIDHSSKCNSSCTNKCNKVIQSWSKPEIDILKSKFKAQKDVETKTNLLNHLETQECVGISIDRYQVKSHKFCNKFFAHITGISIYLIRTVLHDFWRGVRLYEHGNTGIVKQTAGTTKFITWLKDFAEWYGQYSPDQEKIILSYWLRKGVLFRMYLEDSPGPHIKSSTFYQYFDLYFGPNRKLKELPCVRISKYSSHSVCNTCIALNTNRRQSKTDAEMKVAKDLINQHKEVFGGAFRKVQEVKQSALVRPTDHLLLQVDGMDNHKSYLPRYLLNAKELQGTERLASKISGCILWSGLYEAKRKVLFYHNHDQVCCSKIFVLSFLLTYFYSSLRMPVT